MGASVFEKSGDLILKANSFENIQNKNTLSLSV